MCELLGWFHSGGLVIIKQVTISPTGVRCFTSLQGACNLSLITYLTINRQTEASPIWCYALVTLDLKALPPIGPWNKLTEGDHRLHPIVQNVILVSRSEVTTWRNGFSCSDQLLGRKVVVVVTMGGGGGM